MTILSKSRARIVKALLEATLTPTKGEHGRNPLH
jgi:hypothetical protein